VLAADAKKAGSASEDTRLTPRPPSFTREAGLKPLYVCMYVLLLSEASISTMTFQVCWVEPITKPDQIVESEDRSKRQIFCLLAHLAADALNAS